MKGWIVVIVMGLALPRVARAQPGAEPAGAGVCTPACRTGYLCHQGTCISACNPVCGDTEVCTNAGQCVSKCNPLCGANETCTADGQCQSTLVAPPPNLQPSLVPTDRPPTENWAPLAGKLGIATAVVVGALVTAIVIVDETDFGVPAGSVAILATGVMVPVVAAGGTSARKSPGVIGSPGLRLTGWIFYGLAIADGLALLGLAISDADIPPAVTASVGLLGTTSAVFMSLDAFESGKQARTPAPFFQLAARPYVGALRDAGNKTVTTAGLAWSF
jgi:hypothetical protein